MIEEESGEGVERVGLSARSFFFQAEDGIRDIGVTGVQTCALPISQHGSIVFVTYNSVIGLDQPMQLYSTLL